MSFWLKSTLEKAGKHHASLSLGLTPMSRQRARPEKMLEKSSSELKMES
jgi:hypothetical protein